MKKSLLVVVVALLAVGLLIFAVGCGGEKTVKTPEGEITEEGEETTIETEEGKTTYTEGVSEKDLGVPIYPGAELDEESAGTVSTETEGGEETWSGAVLWTDDDISKVIDWYKDELKGNPGFTDTSMDLEGEKVGMFTFQEGDTTKSVIIAEGEEGDLGKVQIVITSGTGFELP